MKKHLPAVLTGIGLLILWQVIAMCINAAYILPSPTQIAVKIWELREPLFTVHTPATMLVTLIGLLISVVLGVGLAVVMERFECVERALYPVIVTTQTIPVTAIAPLFVLWLGYGIWSKVLVAVLITFFPITISVHDGLKSAKRENEELLRTMGMSGTAIFQAEISCRIAVILFGNKNGDTAQHSWSGNGRMARCAERTGIFQ